MSEVTTKLQNILLPVDVSRDSLTALDIAFDLAAALGGEVTGLFIEDVKLLAAGSLPFAREVGSLSGISQPIGTSDIQNRFRAVAGKARDAVAKAGHRRKVRTSFRVTQGDVASEILTAATDADLLVLGKAGWSVGAFRKPGNTCLTILSQSRIPVLIVEEGVSLTPLILAVHDNSDAGRRALDFARELANTLGWQIAVFSAQGMSSGDDVLRRIQGEKPRVVVLPSSLPFSKRAFRLICPVLFVP
jgi:nucleotide-binding universal stress UspA family protein